MLLIIGVLLVLAGAVTGQTLTVEQYRAKVLEYNQDIKQAKEAVNAAMFALKGIKTGFFPKLQVGGNYSYQIEDVEFMQGMNKNHKKNTT